HIFRRHSFTGTCVMRAPRAMNMLVAAIETERRKIDPTLEFEHQFRARSTGHGDISTQAPILRATGELHAQLPGRQQHDIFVAPIDLRLKIEVGREPLGLWRIYMSGDVAENKTGGRSFAVAIAYTKPHWHRWPHVEQNW